MRQTNSPTDSILTTTEWYEKEKENVALSSTFRPHVEDTISYSFRQTSFPNLITSDQD